MLTNHINRTFGFHFKEKRSSSFANITSVGWEKQTSQAYYLDGIQRKESKRAAFQYTLSGRGEMIHEGKKYTLKAGQAFYIHFPSDHTYYLPENSDSWEFIYLTLQGDELLHYHQEILKSFGPVLTLHSDSMPIQKLISIWKLASENLIQDSYFASSLAYQFAMELNRYVHSLGSSSSDWPAAVVKATVLVQEQYDRDLSIDDLVRVSQLSRYHFTRLFKRTMHMTPVQYMTKVRMERAMVLLSSSTASIKEIASQCGYSEPNYFHKVFRKTVGMSAGEFRKQDQYRPVDVMIMD
ncbi:helix-turn-helix transcriptional regulator [Aureibacillus halotolerans]|uniref:AraC-like DNA-binding protein n=1 Tax=Aureibacillus halotolerans TaxID=1508390 RepID=A0A4R6U1Q7_9BACI|nr:AraC family transcriptional regulator [Aureibacillus halotolerans]TDQ40338.1 AraC-like DNA-binding protein [Aureibacillus halotolerans]